MTYHLLYDVSSVYTALGNYVYIIEYIQQTDLKFCTLLQLIKIIAWNSIANAMCKPQNL